MNVKRLPRLRMTIAGCKKIGDIADDAGAGSGALFASPRVGNPDGGMSLLPPSTRRSLPIALLRAREVVMAHFRPMLARHDITEQQWRVLRVLAESGPLEAADLANRASVLPPSLTRIIKAMVERKFVKRSKVKEDGRRAVLAISPAGLALIEDLAPERHSIYDAIEKRYGAERHEQLLDLLERLIQSEAAAE